MSTVSTGMVENQALRERQNLTNGTDKGLLALIRSDAARWVAPGEYTDPAGITLRQIAAIYFRFMSFRAVVWYRIGNWCHRRRLRGLPQLIQHRVQRLYAMEIAMGAPIGEGFYVAHAAGMVLAPESIGRNCSIIASVTIGMRNTWDFPTLGDNVFIGAGARILGGIHVGDDAVIGANAVVIKDVPKGATMVGIPAKPLQRKGEISVEV